MGRASKLQHEISMNRFPIRTMLTGDYSTVYYRTQTNFDNNEILFLSFVGATLPRELGTETQGS